MTEKRLQEEALEAGLTDGDGKEKFPRKKRPLFPLKEPLIKPRPAAPAPFFGKKEAKAPTPGEPIPERALEEGLSYDPTILNKFMTWLSKNPDRQALYSYISDEDFKSQMMAYLEKGAIMPVALNDFYEEWSNTNPTDKLMLFPFEYIPKDVEFLNSLARHQQRSGNDKYWYLRGAFTNWLQQQDPEVVAKTVNQPLDNIPLGLNPVNLDKPQLALWMLLKDFSNTGYVTLDTSSLLREQQILDNTVQSRAEKPKEVSDFSIKKQIDAMVNKFPPELKEALYSIKGLEKPSAPTPIDKRELTYGNFNKNQLIAELSRIWGPVVGLPDAKNQAAIDSIYNELVNKVKLDTARLQQEIGMTKLEAEEELGDKPLIIDPVVLSLFKGRPEGANIQEAAKLTEYMSARGYSPDQMNIVLSEVFLEPKTPQSSAIRDYFLNMGIDPVDYISKLKPHIAEGLSFNEAHNIAAQELGLPPEILLPTKLDSLSIWEASLGESVNKILNTLLGPAVVNKANADFIRALRARIGQESNRQIQDIQQANPELEPSALRLTAMNTPIKLTADLFFDLPAPAPGFRDMLRFGNKVGLSPEEIDLIGQDYATRRGQAVAKPTAKAPSAKEAGGPQPITFNIQGAPQKPTEPRQAPSPATERSFKEKLSYMAVPAKGINLMNYEDPIAIQAELRDIFGDLIDKVNIQPLIGQIQRDAAEQAFRVLKTLEAFSPEEQAAKLMSTKYTIPGKLLSQLPFATQPLDVLKEGKLISTIKQPTALTSEQMGRMKGVSGALPREDQYEFLRGLSLARYTPKSQELMEYFKKIGATPEEFVNYDYKTLIKTYGLEPTSFPTFEEEELRQYEQSLVTPSRPPATQAFTPRRRRF